MDEGTEKAQHPAMCRRTWLVRAREIAEQESPIIREEPLELVVNQRRVAVLMRLPGLEKELAAGYCLSEGLVDSFLDVLIIRHCGQILPSNDGVEAVYDSRNRVEVSVRPEAFTFDAQAEAARLVRAGCGAADVEHAELGLHPVPMSSACDCHTLFGLAEQLRARQTLHTQVGGVHAAAVFTPAGELAMLCEDVGRHNAVDKVAGCCLLGGILLVDKVLLCSGRLSYEMALKAIRLGIPVVASFSAATSLAVQLAERYGLTLIGYLRGRQMTIYTHPERVRVS